MSTVYWLAGFEAGYATTEEAASSYGSAAWGISTVNGSTSYQTGRFGGRSLRLLTNAGSAGQRSFCYYFPNSSADAILGTACLLNSTTPNGTPAGYNMILGASNKDWGINWSLCWNPDLQRLAIIKNYDNSVITYYDVGLDLEADWHYFEAAYHNGSSDGTIKVWLDGVLVINYTGDSNTGRPTVNQYFVGNGAVAGGSNAGSHDHDDTYLIADTTPLGPIKVVSIPPTITASYAWDRSSGSTENHTYVDDFPRVDGSAYLTTNTAHALDQYKVAADISAYTSGVAIKAASFAVIINTGGGMWCRMTDTASATHDAVMWVASGAKCTAEYGNTVNPATSAAWTEANISNSSWGPRAGDSGHGPWYCYNACVNIAIPYIVKTITNTTLETDASPADYEATVTFTAIVKDGEGSTLTDATGTIQFKDGVTNIGSAQTLISGVATLEYDALLPGNHTITATYSGDDNYTSSVSDGLSQEINYVTTTTVVSSSLNPSSATQEVTFTATIKDESGTSTLTGATGTVQFKAGGANIGVPQSVIDGIATLDYSGLVGGTHTITAVYSGDAIYDNSTSPGISQVVNYTSSTTVVTSNTNPASYGASITFTATIKNSNGSSTLTGATGTVQFKADGTNIGTARTVTSGVATLAYSSLPVGTKNITAVYSGDSNYSTSTSPALPQVVNKIVTRVLISSNHNPSNIGQSVTFTATIKDSTGTTTLTTATGTVQFKSNEANIGTPKTVLSGEASYSIAALTDGEHNITAEYSGDSHYATDESDILVQEVSLEFIPTEETETYTEETESTEEFAVKVLSVICVAS